MSVESHKELDLDLLNVIVHDLKSPLSAVKGFVDLVGQTGELNDSQQKFLDRAFLGILRMERIITNLLDFARVEADAPLDKVKCDLPQMIHDAVKLHEELAKKRGITIQVDIPPDFPSVMADEDLLSHVIHNLLTNAIKYNRDKGNISISASDQSSVRLDIRDTGIGIAADDLENIFERFFRSKVDARIEGNGLGLAIARAVIQRHEGHIWVDSVVGEGSTFSFTLPHQKPQDDKTNVAEGRIEGFSVPHRESASEHPDDVDDDLQETVEIGEDTSDEFET